MSEAPVLPQKALDALFGSQPTERGVSLYSIVSAQASGVSDAFLRALAGAKLEEYKGAIDDYLEWFDELENTVPKMTLLAVKDLVYNWLWVDGKFLVDAWKAGLGLQMGTAFMGAIEGYTGYPHLLGIYKQAQINALFRQRLERYFRSVAVPNAPNSALAFRMHMEGKLSRAEFGQYCKEEGWATEWHDKLYAVYDTDPDIFTGFIMWKRGLISEATLNSLFRIAGYDASWDSKLKSALLRLPSSFELMRLADYVELPDLYVRQTLRALGFGEGDINYIAPAIQKRPNREEVRSVVGRYLWEYQIGRIDRDTLKSNLTALGLLPNELTLNLHWADLRYADQLLDLEEDIIEERVYKGDITTQDDIFTELVAIGYQEEYANLLAELWYWEYIVT